MSESAPTPESSQQSGCMDGCFKMFMVVLLIGVVGVLLLGAAGGIVYMNRDKLNIPLLDQQAVQAEKDGRDKRASENGGSQAEDQSIRRPIAAESPMYVDTVSFPKVSQRTDVLVLVDFYADWCGPCKKLAPSLEKLAQEHGDKVIVLKVNVDSEKQLAQQAGVRSIPDVRLLHGGKQVDQFVGLIPYEKIEQLILNHESLLPPPQNMPVLQQAAGEGSVDPVTGKYLPPGITRGKK